MPADGARAQPEQFSRGELLREAHDEVVSLDPLERRVYLALGPSLDAKLFGQHLQQILTNILSGARITPMNDADHYRHCTTFLNPSLGSRFEYDTLETFDSQLSIQQNCWHSEAQGIADTSGFRLAARG